MIGAISRAVSIIDVSGSQGISLAVSMNFGPLVLMDFGPPPEFNLLRRA
jgi:hypothetical protein